MEYVVEQRFNNSHCNVYIVFVDRSLKNNKDDVKEPPLKIEFSNVTLSLCMKRERERESAT